MWIVTNKLIFSLYPEDTVEQQGKDIRITRAGCPEQYNLHFNSVEETHQGWKKLQDAIKKGFQNVSIYDCEAEKKDTGGKKGRIF